MRAPVRVWPDPPDFQNHPCNLLHGWMDGGRKGGREEGRDGKHTTGKTNYRTEGPWAKAYTHTHTHNTYVSFCLTGRHSHGTVATHIQ